MRVTEQALPQRQRVNRQCHPVNEGVPAVRLLVFDRREIPLDQSFVAQRTQFLQLALADALARAREIPQRRFGGEFLIKRDQFAQLVAAGVGESRLDRWQFMRKENALVIAAEKFPQRRQARDRSRAQRIRQRVQRRQPIRRAELLRERMRGT